MPTVRSALRPAAALALALAGCGAPSRAPAAADTGGGAPGARDGDTGAAPPAGLALSAVQWAVDWQPDRVERRDQGWALAREDGVAIEVDAAHLVVYVLVLEPCSSARGQRTAAADLPVPPPHSLPDHASALSPALAVDMGALAGARADGALAFPEADFCQLGVGLLRGDTITENVPEGVDLNGISLMLEGRLRAGPTADWTPLSLVSSLPAEADLALPATAPAAAVQATLSLDPGALLDGVDPADDPARIALDMLENLATTGTVSLAPLD